MLFSRFALLLAVSASLLLAHPIWVPDTYVSMNSSIEDRMTPGRTTPFRTHVATPGASASGTLLTQYAGFSPGPIDAGTLTTESSASVVGGQLKAKTSVQGTLAAHRAVQADASASYSDILQITGPVTPHDIVLEATIHGTANALSGTDWTSLLFAARLELLIYLYNETNSTPFNSIVHSVEHAGDGSTATLRAVVPWSAVHENQLGLTLLLYVFGRPQTDGAPAVVSFLNDYNSTAGFSSVAARDSGGNDITSLMNFSFTRQAAEVPEPATGAVIAAGLLAFCLGRKLVRSGPAAR